MGWEARIEDEDGNDLFAIGGHIVPAQNLVMLAQGMLDDLPEAVGEIDFDDHGVTTMAVVTSMAAVICTR